jgi:hypothetical protein
MIIMIMQMLRGVRRLADTNPVVMLAWVSWNLHMLAAVRCVSFSNSCDPVALCVTHSLSTFLAGLSKVMGGIGIVLPFIVVPVRGALGYNTNQYTKKPIKRDF